nr:hypothetical protein HK105_000552 [Polyrhizophydium stewartii]
MGSALSSHPQRPARDPAAPQSNGSAASGAGGLATAAAAARSTLLQAGGTYFGPHFVFDEQQGDQPNGPQTTQAFWDEILNVLAGGPGAADAELAGLGNVYSQMPPAELKHTTTLQALVALQKNSVRIVPATDGPPGHYSLEFGFDSTAPCRVRLFWGAREVYSIGDDGETVMQFTACDGTPVLPWTFGPFEPGLGQRFVLPQELLFDPAAYAENPGPTPAPGLGSDPQAPHSAGEPTNNTAVVQIDNPERDADSTSGNATQVPPPFHPGVNFPSRTTTLIGGAAYSMQEIFGFTDADQPSSAALENAMEIEEGVSDRENWVDVDEYNEASDGMSEEDDDNDGDYDDDGSLDLNSATETERKASTDAVAGQIEMRKQIQQIQADTQLTGAEKAKRIQELMTKRWVTKQQKETSKEVRYINRLADKKQDFSIISEEDKQVTYHAPGIMGCKHYQRCAKLQAHCCGKWDTCRFCHDEVSDHTITRNLVVTMMCMFCSMVQPAGQDCINPECGKRVARYYCKECKLWDDDPRKTIYHCHDCGICRIGKGLGIDYFHCPTCNVCMAIGLKGRHKCIERNLESDCPICGEYMFTSTSTVIFMYIQTSYQCPTCLKSLADMTEYFRRIDATLAQHQMPPEYNDTFSYIYCNDCEKKCYAKYHFIYHKCAFCNGYNTKLLQTRSGLPPDAAIAREAPALPTQLFADGTTMRCISCSSDFVEEL